MQYSLYVIHCIFLKKMRYIYSINEFGRLTRSSLVLVHYRYWELTADVKVNLVDKAVADPCIH